MQSVLQEKKAAGSLRKLEFLQVRIISCCVHQDQHTNFGRSYCKVADGSTGNSTV